nr:MAG TPA: hypothetical protein [Caudoviricetes sp.]
MGNLGDHLLCPKIFKKKRKKKEYIKDKPQSNPPKSPSPFVTLNI